MDGCVCVSVSDSVRIQAHRAVDRADGERESANENGIGVGNGKSVNK